MNRAAEPRPRLSVIVNFYNMRREADRTLHSLTPAYQQRIDDLRYEVIALDNGSSEPLDADRVRAFVPQFRYQYVDTRSPSPCAALNAAVRAARGEWFMVCIDGARILSPGIIHYSLLATRLWPRPFVYTVGMHLGHKVQNLAALEGYDQRAEDELLAGVDWQGDGYQLFRIACLGSSYKQGFFRQQAETTCFLMSRADYLSLGGYDEAFQMPGGGLCNHDWFNRAHRESGLQPVLLVGEATFHQFHGGVATNALPDRHPWQAMAADYARIRSEPYATCYQRPACLGAISEPFEILLEAGPKS